MPTTIPAGKYRAPTMPRICAGAEKLYALEEKRDKLIHQCAEEQGRVMGFDPKHEFWTHCLPEQIASILEAFDQTATELAAMAWLEKRGWRGTPGGDLLVLHKEQR